MKKLISVSAIVILICISTILLYPKKKVDKEEKLAEELNMLSYIVDGETSSEKPSKDSYIVNKIICDSGSNIIWDNINWEVSLTKLESTDKCKVEFISKDSSNTDGRIVTIEEGKDYVDSYSKTTVDKGTIKFYPKSGYDIKSVSGCTNAIIEDNKLIVNNVTKNETCNVLIEKKLGPFVKQILADNPTVCMVGDKCYTNGKEDTEITPRANFTVKDETAYTKNVIYKETENFTEDGSDVYYYAGNIENNWVKFGKSKNGENLYWRIIRTNEDGSIRLLYSGSSSKENTSIPTMTNGYISTNISYNSTYYDSMYVGYMYGSSGSLENNRKNIKSSTVKEVIDAWYAESINIKTDDLGNIYDDYVSKTAIYCNDRSTPGGYSSTNMMYGAWYRLMSKQRPSYKCGANETGKLYANADIADKFTKSNKTGNGLLTYPIALMTADEVLYAGGSSREKVNAWYYNNTAKASATSGYYWWTMTPIRTRSSSLGPEVALVRTGDYAGRLDTWSVTHENVYGTRCVRPVISLKACVEVASGNGSSESPYTVSLTAECALQDE